MTIGDRLREARESRNVTLHDIAERTNISVRFLDAMEKGHIDKLPGGIFTRGFVRSYAAQVGLDPDETVKAFVAAHPQVRTDDEVEDAEERSWAPALAVVGGVLLLLVVIAVGALWWRSRPAAATRTPSPAPTASVAEPTAEQTPATPAPVNVVTNAPPSAETPATPVTQDAPQAVEQAAVSTMPLRLTVAPVGRCWVQVKADGRVQLAREVLPGERVDIEAGERLEIVAGDAGTFAYRLNGEAGRQLGVAGRVGRAAITTENVASFQASR